MASRTSQIQVKLVATDGSSEPGKIRIQTWDKKDRVKRAIKVWGLCWLGAIVAVLIPMLHFVLVPSLFLGGPIAAAVFYHQEETILSGTSRCPACSGEFSIAKARPRFPLHDICSSCQEPVRIERVD